MEPYNPLNHQSKDQIDHNLFNLTIDANAVIRITTKEGFRKQATDPVLLLEKFGALLLSLLDPTKNIRGIIYHCPIGSEVVDYRALFEAAKSPDFTPRIQRILEWSATIKQAKIPVVAVLDGAVNSLQMAPMLWAHYIMGTTRTKIRCTDCSLGISPGLGTTVYIVQRLALEDAAAILIKGASYNHEQALASGLLDAVVQDSSQLGQRAVDWILTQPNGAKSTEGKSNATKQQINTTDTDQMLAVLKKKANLKFPGTSACFELIAANIEGKLTLEELLQLEAVHYTSVLQNPLSLAIIRTMYYGVQAAKRPLEASSIHEPAPEFKKIGIIGAGMMGAGIAFEVARAGLQAVLKDTKVELARRGKAYTTKCCDKLIAMGRMAATQKEAMEALIEPTDNVMALQEADAIIEAVFEQATLKNAVIHESEAMLASNGFVASNTTSLPISRLALSCRQPENFIGMHFFSPVDRMPLVEIILGKQTSQQTLNKAKALALKLGKTPIVVHDSPAFFTSRIFFNYLLEAITMLLEGIPAELIEKEALKAGFAVSPLAVLDEISLPLMVHVYDQLPALSNSQQRTYNYLSSLINQGRTGRKSNKGFYTYDAQTGKKALWQDSNIQVSPTITSNNGANAATNDATIDSNAVQENNTFTEIIQKRLLHVMALDSYRLLDEGVLDRPIDGDIGSILGVGYAAHTGGVFSHIDQTGLQQFVQDCKSFSPYGEQWQMPVSLIDLASKNFTFYDGFNSNWPLTKG